MYIILYVILQNVFCVCGFVFYFISFHCNSPAQFFSDPYGNQPINTADLRAAGTSRVVTVIPNTVTQGHGLEYLSGEYHM